MIGLKTKKINRLIMEMDNIDIPKVEFLAANQCIIRTNDGTFLQSYDSTIVFIPSMGKGKIQLGKDWDISTTTSKYRNIFLREKKPETEKKLQAGIYEINKQL